MPLRLLLAAMLIAGCGGEDPGSAGAPQEDGATGGTTDGTPPAPDGDPVPDLASPPFTSLPTTPGTYQGACDGSGAVALDGDHFLDVNDENQQVRVFRRGSAGTAVQSVDVNGGLGLVAGDEADLEDAAMIGKRVYVIASHGRNKNGKLAPTRQRFFAIDVGGTAPAFTLQVAGSSSTLLADMLDAANWTTPDTALITLLTSTTQFGKGTDANLAPEVGGTNIEGLAALPSATVPGRLVIGFRNPQSGTSAVLVTLLNADAVLTGAKASFGESIKLDLGGLGVRAMAWSPAHQALLIVAGAKAAGAFRLYRWSGDPQVAPVAVQDLTPPADRNPEAIVAWPGTLDVQILYDQGDLSIGGTTCKLAPVADQYFSDQIVHVPL
jgi:hypothetical protein